MLEHVITEDMVKEFAEAQQKQIDEFVDDATKAILRELEYCKRRRSVFCFDEYPREWVEKLVKNLNNAYLLYATFEEIGGREHVVTKKKELLSERASATPGT